ncbi:MAG: rhodanese-like domain-containing protein, partial [Pseudomonadota bacterium]
MRLLKIAGLCFALSAAFVVAGLADGAEARDLRSVHADIVADYPNVAHRAVADVEPAAPNLLLFDVREDDEYAVSRLPGALRLDPDADVDAFMAQYGALIGGRDVIFYCSVGVRSSR